MSDGSELLHKMEDVLSEMKEQRQRAQRNASLVNALSGHERRAGIWEPAPAGEGTGYRGCSHSCTHCSSLYPALSGMRVLLPWLFSGQATERHFELWQLDASTCSGALYTFDGMQVLNSLASPSPGAAIKRPVRCLPGCITCRQHAT